MAARAPGETQEEAADSHPTTRRSWPARDALGRRLGIARRLLVIDTQLLDLDWSDIVSNLTHVLVAYLIALPIGWERERAGAGMGLRTFPLVALASCGYLLVARDIAVASPDAQSRVIQGLLGGIGFIGGGAILKEGGSVRGTATAASIWNTGAIGLAVAFDRFEIAIVLGLINFATLRWLTPLVHEVEAEARHTYPSSRGASDTQDPPS